MGGVDFFAEDRQGLDVYSDGDAAADDSVQDFLEDLGEDLAAFPDGSKISLSLL